MHTRYMFGRALAPAIAVAAPFFLPLTAVSQNRLLPDTPTFSYPLASPQVEGLVARIVETSVADNPLGTGAEGDVRIGKIFPLIAAGSSESICRGLCGQRVDFDLDGDIFASNR